MRDRIVAAALECIQEHGVRGATTKLVARRAGVSEGSIYNHFTNRSELIVDAFRAATQPIREHAHGLRQLVGTSTVEDNVVTLMEVVIEFLRDVSPIAGSVLGDAELRSWFASGAVPDPEGQPLSPLTGVVELGDYLRREHEMGRLPERASWVTCASMLIGACLHYVYVELLSPSGITSLMPAEQRSAREHARAAVRALFGEGQR